MLKRHQETPSLRKGLEAKGFTVRSHVPEDKESKFPKSKKTHKAIVGGEKNTLLNKCMENLQQVIEQEELATENMVDFGLIGDIVGCKKKTLAIARVGGVDYEEFKNGDIATFTLTEPFTLAPLTCNIVGEIRHSEPTFHCTEAVTKSFFDSLGKLEDGSRWIDKVELEKEKEKAAAKVQKKRAKKNRKQMTTSTSTSPIEESCLSPESSEAVKARQREKNKAKKKAQKERKQAKLSKEFADAISAIKTPRGILEKEKEEKSTETRGQWSILGMSGSYLILQNELGRLQIKQVTDMRSSGSVRGSIVTNDSKDGGANDNQSSGGGSDQDGDQETEIVRVETVDEIKREVEKRKGQGPIFTVAKADDEDRSSKGLRYVGKGL